VALALLMGGGWPIRYCGTVGGFEIDLESAQIESRSHCSPIKSRTYNLLLRLLSSVVNLILDKFIQWVQGYYWQTIHFF